MTIPLWLIWSVVFIFAIWCLRIESGAYISSPTGWLPLGFLLLGVWVYHSIIWIFKLVFP